MEIVGVVTPCMLDTSGGECTGEVEEARPDDGVGVAGTTSTCTADETSPDNGVVVDVAGVVSTCAAGTGPAVSVAMSIPAGLRHFVAAVPGPAVVTAVGAGLEPLSDGKSSLKPAEADLNPEARPDARLMLLTGLL